MLQSAYTLAKRGHRVILITSRASDVDIKGNPSIYVWPSKRPTRWRDFVFLNRLISQYDPDCLVTDGYASSNIILITGWLRRVNLRVSWYHTLTTQINLRSKSLNGWRQIKQKILHKRKYLVWRITKPYFIANSELSRQDVSNYLKLNNRERAYAFNYLLADPLKSMPDHKELYNPNYFICPGRLDHDKGQETLIRAVAALKKEYPETVVEFAGDGPLRSHYERLARELDVENQCLFPGRIDYKEVLKKMASACAMILPSLDEAFGLVNIEAMSVGTPVIASCVGGIPEIIRDNIDGFLIPPGDQEELAIKMRFLMNSADLREKMGKSARQRFEEKYDMDKNIDKLADWFEVQAKKR